MGENKYQNGKIYKIVDIGYNKCYIGSTCESLNMRMARHRYKYKYYLQGKVEHTRSFYLFDEYCADNCKIELIEYFPCNTKEELLAREGHYIKTCECINKQIAGRTKAEYNQENIEDNRERCKQWRKNNPDKHKASNRRYIAEHKEELSTKYRAKIECECGCYISYRNMSAHKRSKKHQNNLKQKSETKEEEK